MSSGLPAGSQDARPGPGWGRAIPFVAVLAIVFAIVGTVINVQIVDSYGSSGAATTLAQSTQGISPPIAGSLALAGPASREESPRTSCQSNPGARSPLASVENPASSASGAHVAQTRHEGFVSQPAGCPSAPVSGRTAASMNRVAQS
ncbi:MAG: hypothetical protein ABSD85_02980 [Acidimicrobiales bacterium]